MIQFFNNFLKYKYLMGQLVKKNIKLRYRRSYLGMLWTLIEPLLTMIVLSVWQLVRKKQYRCCICRRAIPDLCLDRTFAVFVLFISNQQCDAFHSYKRRYD